MIYAEWHEACYQPNDRSGGEKRQWCSAIVEASDAVPNQHRNDGGQSAAGHDEQRHLPRQACGQHSQTDCIDPVRGRPPQKGWPASEQQPSTQQEQAGHR